MRQYFNAMVTIVTCLLALLACSKTESNPIVDKPANEAHRMVFNGNVAGYDDTVLRDGSSTRATSSWQNGDKVYIAFFNGSEVVAGKAQYNETDGWSVTFDGDLAEGSGLRCEVRYFVNPTFANDFHVNLNPHSEIYEDVNGTYDFAGGTLSVTASLVPKVGRLRFTGKAGDKIYITGIETNSRYSPENNSFYSTKGMLSVTVDNDGSTPYIYGVCSYSDRKVGVVGSDYAFTKYFPESIYKQGESGYMAIPTTDVHNGWKSGLFVTAGNVEFKMIPVHGFEDGLFLIGETEVTNAMFEMKSSASSATYPHLASYSSWQGYISKLNSATNLTFHIPSRGEWQFAAKGGKLSQGYTYSGSNYPEDVAWYSGNSNNASHPVKQLAPNELGIYDMSGNVAEWTSTPYSSGSYYLCGGDYASSEANITVTSYTSYSTNNSFGLRVALKCE